MRRKVRGIIALALLLAVISTITVNAFAEGTTPRGNLASIYQSDTPYYGNSSTYSILDADYVRSVEFDNALYRITQAAFVGLVTAACPELGGAVASAFSASDLLEAAHTILSTLAGTREETGLYVRTRCYLPVTQPTPNTVVYSKYVIDFYTDSELTNRIASARQVYYQKMVYRLNG